MHSERIRSVLSSFKKKKGKEKREGSKRRISKREIENREHALQTEQSKGPSGWVEDSKGRAYSVVYVSCK